jgi:peptidoglycan/LPS O-acetylase OafA/YrhL
MSYESRLNRDRRPLAAFFLRRLFRIAPLFWLAIPIYTWLLGTAPRPMAPLGIHLPEILATALFVHGWHPSTINAVVPGGWSIAVEMNFYLLLPVCFSVLTNLRRAVAACLIAFAGSIAVSVLTRRWLAGAWPDQLITDFTYYWLPRQFPVFLLGFVLFFLIRRRSAADPARGVPAEAIAVLLLVAALFGQRLPLAYFWFSCGFAWLALALWQRPAPLLVNRFTRYVGKVSYSAYITHFLVAHVLDRLGLGAPAPGPSALVAVARFLGIYLLCAAGTLLLSTVTHHLVEVPGQDLGRNLIQRLGFGTGPRVEPAKPVPGAG